MGERIVSTRVQGLVMIRRAKRCASIIGGSVARTTTGSGKNQATTTGSQILSGAFILVRIQRHVEIELIVYNLLHLISTRRLHGGHTSTCTF